MLIFLTTFEMAAKYYRNSEICSIFQLSLKQKFTGIINKML